MYIRIIPLDEQDEPRTVEVEGWGAAARAASGMSTWPAWLAWAYPRSGIFWEIAPQVQALALRVIADRLEHGEVELEPGDEISFRYATDDSWEAHHGKGFRSARAKVVLAALIHRGWSIKRRLGAHPVLGPPSDIEAEVAIIRRKAGAERVDIPENVPRWPDIVFAFDDEDELGERTVAAICERAGILANGLGSAG